MTRTEAASKARQFHEEWVGRIPVFETYDLERIHASMLQEHRWNRQHPARCTSACAAETFGKLILLGKIRKALGVQS